MNTLTTKNFNRKIFQNDLLSYSLLRQNMFHPKSDIQLDGKKLQNLRSLYMHIDSSMLITYMQPFFQEKIKSLKRLTVKSTFHVLFAVETPKKKFILKLNLLQDIFRDFSFCVEEALQKKLRENKLSDVTVIADISRIHVPYDFLIMDFVNGENMETYAGHDISTLYNKLGTIFKIIHAFPVKKAGVLNYKSLLENGSLRGTSDTWQEFFKINLLQHIRECLALGFLSKDDAKDIKAIFTALLPKLTDTSLSLLHNDTSARNIFTNGKQITGILDWEDSIIGDPLWEIAFIDTFLFSKNDRVKFEAFCMGYGIALEKVLLQPIYWMYNLRNSMLKTISRNREGYYNAKGPHIDKMRISKALKNLKKLTK